VGFELAWAGAHLDDGPRPVMPMCEFGQGCDDRFAVGALGGDLRLMGEHEGARGRGSGDRDRVWGASRGGIGAGLRRGLLGDEVRYFCRTTRTTQHEVEL